MSKIKVLLIEDNLTVTWLNKRVLESGGYEVITAADGESGVAAAIAETPDVILLDIILPKMHGFEVFRELQKHSETKHIPVIVVTGGGFEEIVEKEPELAVKGILTKPTGFKDLDVAIRKALAKKT